MTRAEGRHKPAAAGAAVLDWQSMADGRRLVRRSWPLPGARHAVLIVHGLGEHSGRYAALAAWFGQRGYDVRSYDQRGHGKTPGRRGALPRPLALLEDLAEVYAAYAADRAEAPLLLGHSMGGLVALRAVLDGRIRPGRLILSSPALRTWQPRWQQAMVARLARWLPRLPLRNGLPMEALSHDESVVVAYHDDPLRHGWVTPRLGDFVMRTGATCIADAARLNLPTLLLAAGADRLVDPSGSRDFAQAAAGTPLTYHPFEPLYHELFNEGEPARSEVLSVLARWLG
jgi:alpha-beta hydrolase superfamily lysophospholipase